MIFRKENEYIIEIIPQHLLRLVCIKVKKNVKGEIESYTFNNPVTNETSTYLVKETNKFLKVIEPVDNLEMFKMHINWLNFKREGLHQDLVFAKQIAEKISNTLKERSYVMYGAGSWVDYDFRKRDEILNIEQIQDNPSVIDAVEKTVRPVASTPRLQKAIDCLRSMDHAQYSEFVEKHK